MARLARTVVASASVAALVALCGCAAHPKAQTSYTPPPVSPMKISPLAAPAGETLKAVEVYLPRSSEEAAAQAALELADAAARKRIEQAMEAYDAVELPPPDAERAAIEAAMEKRRAAVAAYQQEIAAGRKTYDEFLRAYPHNWYARHRYAWFLSDNGLRFEAAAEWEKVIQLEPRFPYAYNNLGSLFNHMGRDGEAMQLYRKALELKEDDADFHANLAVNYSTHRQEAMDLFGWSLPEVFWNCIGEYRRARELSPKDPDIARDLATQFIMAKYFNVMGTADEALKEYSYYLSLDLSDIARAAACRDVGRIYLREKNDPRSAIPWLEKAVALMDDPGSRTLLEQARAALDQQKPPAP